MYAIRSYYEITGAETAFRLRSLVPGPEKPGFLAPQCQGSAQLGLILKEAKMRISKVSMISLGVNDLEKSTEFYRNVLIV